MTRLSWTEQDPNEAKRNQKIKKYSCLWTGTEIHDTIYKARYLSDWRKVPALDCIDGVLEAVGRMLINSPERKGERERESVVREEAQQNKIAKHSKDQRSRFFSPLLSSIFSSVFA